MKIIQVHNYYQQAGGEDAVVTAELELLRSHGHEVVTYYKDNEVITASSNKLLAIGQLLKASLSTLWNHSTYREFRKLLQAEKPDIVHCHNIFPLISPSIYWACAKESVPVVQTLHNYRLLCLNAFLFRGSRHEALGIRHKEELATKNTKEHEKEDSVCSAYSVVNKGSSGSGICELCVSKTFKWPGIKYGCYRDSKAGSLVVALMLLFHKLIGTWSKKVTAYIALTEFQKQKMIEGRLPAENIFVKPNFIQTTEDSTTKDTKHTKGGREEFNIQPLSDSEFSVPSVVKNPYCLFVGRLSPEKGCDVLIRAWGKFQEKLIANGCKLTADQKPQLLIVGDGPEREELELLATSYELTANIQFLGQQPKESVLSLMRNTQFFVLPSVWYEGFPMTIVEAFSCSTAVVASDDGGMSEIIIERQNGLKFEMGDDAQLAEKMKWAFGHPSEIKEMGMAARREFEGKYSAEENAKILINIYALQSED